MYVGCLVILGYLAFYVFTHMGAMADDMLGEESQTSDEEYWRALGSVLLPVAALFILLIALVVVAFSLQSRSIADFERLMEGVSRIRRDSIGVARTRTTSLVVEEAVQKARRSFTLQLWLGRSLFVASLLLVFAFVIYSMVTGDLDAVSATLGAGSIVSFAVASITNQSDKIGIALANVTQLQVVTMTTAERLGVVSEYAYSVLEDKNLVTQQRDVLLSNMSRGFRELADDALRQIQTYAEPGNDRLLGQLPPPLPTSVGEPVPVGP